MLLRQSTWWIPVRSLSFPGLAHEADHAVQANTNPGQYQNDSNTPSGDFKTKEEQRVIQGSEKKIAKDLDEPTRDTHKALPGHAHVRTPGPTQKNPATSSP
jgi:hypothetical protein